MQAVLQFDDAAQRDDGGFIGLPHRFEHAWKRGRSGLGLGQGLGGGPSRFPAGGHERVGGRGQAVVAFEEQCLQGLDVALQAGVARPQLEVLGSNIGKRGLQFVFNIRHLRPPRGVGYGQLRAKAPSIR